MTLDLPVLIDFWRGRLQRDIAPFADPGTELAVDNEGRTLSASWRQRGDDRTASFNVSLDSGVQVVSAGKSLTYRSFLAGPGMADLMGLAKMTLLVRPSPIYVDTKASRADDPQQSVRPAAAVLSSALKDKAAELATLVVMVTGEAGAGKTSVLQHLVRLSADAYIRGQTDSLLLYVNAQGRALARFNEALATELQDLRANLTYHAVSSLVRNGLLIPVIDGFDELIGVSGYDDAFSSLAAFIEELDGSGRLIASARSTYYEQEFVARANRASALGSQVWHQVPVQVRAWGDEEVVEYVTLRATHAALSPDATADLHREVGKVFRGSNATLRSKPFFVVRTVDLLLDGVSFGENEDLLDAMVQAYLDRERAQKLLTRAGGFLLSIDQLRALLVDLAEEMWNQETRELDRRSVREVAEFVLVTTGADDAAQKIVIERMPSLAFLAPSQRTGGVSFEHETFFAYFLAHRFADALASSSGSAAPLLGRSILPIEVADTAVRLLDERQVPEQEVLDRLAVAGSVTGPKAPQVRENAGAIAATLLSHRCATQGCRGLRIEGLTVPGGQLPRVVLQGAQLTDVIFRRTDLTTTRFIDCLARDVTLYEVLVSPTHTRLELQGLDPATQIIGMRATGDRDEVRLFDPEELQRVLVATGAAAPMPPEESPYRRVAKTEFKLLERFARAYNRSNPVCTSDDNMTGVFGHHSWPRIQRLLEETGVVTAEKRGTGGPSKTFLRRQVLAEEIMTGVRRDAAVPNSVRAFWDGLEGEFPSPEPLGT